MDNTLAEGTTEVHIYESLYFDLIEWVHCTLTFRITNGVFAAEWRLLNNEVIFRGEGFLMNERQIAISYWSVRSIA